MGWLGRGRRGDQDGGGGGAVNLPYWKMVAKGLESDLAASRAECERLLAQRGRMAEVLRDVEQIVPPSLGGAGQTFHACNVVRIKVRAALRDLDKEVQGG